MSSSVGMTSSLSDRTSLSSSIHSSSSSSFSSSGELSNIIIHDVVVMSRGERESLKSFGSNLDVTLTMEVIYLDKEHLRPSWEGMDLMRMSITILI